MKILTATRFFQDRQERGDPGGLVTVRYWTHGGHRRDSGDGVCVCCAQSFSRTRLSFSVRFGTHEGQPVLHPCS